MIRIVFIGAGAVGGYFGGLMSEHYKDSKDIEVYFVCREKTSQHIKEKGLNLETTHGNYNAQLKIYSEDEHRSIKLDYIICCSKSFDLLESIIPLKENIGMDTVIIPLLNGVDSYDKIKSILPETEVWDACVYIVSRLIEPGHIKETGGIQLFYFGSRITNSPKLKIFENILVNAGIKAKHSIEILQTIWEKFLFISSIATLTSYLDKSIGEILSNEDYKSIFHSLLIELKMLADAKNIQLPANIFDTIYDRMQKLPFEATSSMHRDFMAGKKTELETLTGAVVRMANELHVQVPQYDKIYLELVGKPTA